MKTILKKYTTSVAYLAVAALLMTGCSDADDHDGRMHDATMETTDHDINHPGTHNNSTLAPTDQVNQYDRTIYTQDGGLIITDVRINRTPAKTPAEERAYATKDLNAIRAPLVAELERVRARLNKGDRPEAATKADQARAAELAQGLERVDRALVAIGESTDLTWKTVRDSQMKEVEDVREWMSAYRTDRTSSQARM